MNANKPIWISHRGLCKGRDTDENSLEAFTDAVDAGFDYLETDLRVSKGGEIFLSHDRFLTRLTGDDRAIDKVSSSELRLLNTVRGSRLVTLDEFLAKFPDKGHVFDIKPETGREVVDLLCLRSLDLSKTIFLFWDAGQQYQLLENFPSAVCFARLEACRRAGFGAMVNLPGIGGIQRGGIYSVPPSFYGINLFTKKMVNVFHNRGAKILAFLPRTVEDAKKAVNAGFDYILSDFPPLG